MLDLIQWRARKTPEAPALFFNGRWYCFRELEGRANRLANRLLGLGIRRGDRVAVLANNHLVHFDLLLAAPKIGVVFAPFNPHLGHDGLIAHSAVIKPQMLFADSRYHATAESLGVPWMRLGEYRDWLAVGSLDLPPAPALEVDEPHTLFATPHGVAVLPYRQVLLNARHAADAWGLSAQDGTVHCLPCHGPELYLLCLPLLYRGGRVVLMSDFDTDEYLGHLALHRVTVSALSPQMLRQLVDYSDFENADLSSLNWFASVGAPATRTVARALAERGLALRTLHVLAEVGPNLFTASAAESSADPTLLGAPLPDVTAGVVLADGTPSAADEVGALTISGSLVFKGYLDDAEATAQRMHDGRCHTGVMVRRNAAGQFYWLGLAAQRFVCNGCTIYPSEIEVALLQLDGVLDCAVIGIDDAQHGTASLAALVLQEGAELDLPQLCQALAPLLPEPLWPQHVLKLGALPRDAWGEVKRLALAQAFVQSRLAAA